MSKYGPWLWGLMLLFGVTLATCELPAEPDTPAVPYHRKDFATCVFASPKAVAPGSIVNLDLYAEPGAEFEYEWGVPGGTIKTRIDPHTGKPDDYWVTPANVSGIATVHLAIYIPRKVDGRPPSYVHTLTGRNVESAQDSWGILYSE